MKNSKLKELLNKYPDECDVQIRSLRDEESIDISLVTAEYGYDDDYTSPDIYLEVLM